MNIAGEIMDLEAGGRAEGRASTPSRVADGIVAAYHALVGGAHRQRGVRARRGAGALTERVKRLNDLGFDIERAWRSRATDDGTTVRIQPKVVDAGHHQRRLLRLDRPRRRVRTPARARLLNDLDVCSARAPSRPGRLTRRWWPTSGSRACSSRSSRRSRADLRAKLEPAEVFHQLLEHRWFMSQAEGKSVPLAEALTSYIDNVLRHRRATRRR